MGTTSLRKPKRGLWAYALCGVGAGLINGLFGTGGGILLVFFYLKILGLTEKESLSTCLPVMAALSCISAAFLFQGVAVDPWIAFLYAAGGTAGGVIGALVFKNLKPTWLRKAFAVFLLWAGIRAVFL